ncbi:MAG: DUF167 domain-containing protein [Nitrospinae bacterium]|nr:DUF167 domain-containing protein [Nitrospinota bacterium]
MEPPFDLTEDGEGVTFAVRVARAGKSAVAGLHDGALKIRIAAPPVEGAANEELIAFVARLLKVPKRNVTLVSGDASKNKRVRIAGVTAEAVRGVL